MKRYLIGDVGHYHQGTIYPPGSVIQLPDNVKPSRMWTEIVPEPAAPAPAPVVASAPAGGKGKRPSDGSPV